jgi:isopenicillin-N epimerase
MREHFLLDPDTVFLNHGSYGACPREVFAACQGWQLEMERNPVAFLGRRSAELLGTARAALAGYVGARGEDLVFVPNATTGVNIVARSLQLRPGDEVLGTDHEYGACEAALRFVCDRAGAQYRRVEIPLPYEAADLVERMMAAVTPRTKLVYASHLTSVTALVFPVAELCAAARQRGLRTLIDGAHAPGQLPLDLDALGADYYTGNCHKWLCAPKGSAFLHARPERQADIEATVVSWGYLAEGQGGHTGFDAYTGRTTLERRLQWQGTRDLSAFLAVPAAIDFQRRHDWPAQQARCHALAVDAARRLRGRNGLSAVAPDEAYGQMVTMPVRCDDALALHRGLYERYRIEIPVTQHAGQSFVRLSVQAYNTEAEVDTLLGALAEAGV